MFAAILFNMDSNNNPKLKKFKRSQQWRLQFWIFLPFIWMINKSSFHTFLTLKPRRIEIWFDLCLHHIWMLLLCIVYMLYPYIYDIDRDPANPEQLNFNFLSVVLYVVAFCVTFSLTMIYKLRYLFNRTS